jgi:hypothetical protein
MTDKQENYFSMFILLFAFLTKFSALVNTIPAFQRAVQKLGLLIEEIKKVDSSRPTIKSGKAEVKSTSKNSLVSAVYLVASSLYTYADEKNKPEIFNRVNKSESDYKRMRDTSLILEARELIKLTVGIETDLLDHGLTAEEIASVTSLAAEYEAAMQNLGESEAEGFTATKSVYQLIGEIKNLIDNQISVHVAKFRTKNPDFYSQYLSASRIIDAGVRHEKKETTATGTTTATGSTTTN